MEIAKPENLKKRMLDLDPEVYEILISNFGISKFKFKEEQINDILRLNFPYQVENHIDNPKKIKIENEKINKRKFVENLRESFKDELLRLNPRVLDQCLWNMT